MAKSKKQAYISPISDNQHSLIFFYNLFFLSPKKSSKNKTMLWKNPRFWFLSSLRFSWNVEDVVQSRPISPILSQPMFDSSSRTII
ncbi:hypothetical protein LOK49_LG02G01302 [Camellia lanceoleosa]|uniref:Uncharacterized protein n=1 Tax=Camellia lanceoleosa TaxID=1840588 RepID=A0ACC0ITX4_9ERIC|nr:hypothetical protein LOK49_LG02G01302 [Camellia lanceoleosa]